MNGCHEQVRERASPAITKVRTPVVVLAGTISMDMDVQTTTAAIHTQTEIVVTVIQPHALPPLLGQKIIVVEIEMDLAGVIFVPLAEAMLGHRLLQHLHLLLRLTTWTNLGDAGRLSGRWATKSGHLQHQKTVTTTRAYWRLRRR